MQAKLARISWGKMAAHITLLALVALWTFPTVGLMISSVRDKEQLSISGWWTALVTTDRNELKRLPTATAQVKQDGKFVISGKLFEPGTGRSIKSFGLSSKELDAALPGQSLKMRTQGEITVNADGTYRWVSDKEFTHTRGPRLFFVVEVPPRFTLENYVEVITSEGIGRSFVNSFTVRY